MIRLSKDKPIDKIKMECGFGCEIIVRTIQKFTQEEKWILFEKEIDSHNKIFHSFKLDAKVILK